MLVISLQISPFTKRGLFFICFDFFFFGSHPVMLISYSWFCIQESLLKGSIDHFGMPNWTWISCLQGKKCICCTISLSYLFGFFDSGIESNFVYWTRWLTFTQCSSKLSHIINNAHTLPSGAVSAGDES